jgi:hypothetical protein
MNNRLVILGAGIGGLSVIKELRESGVPLNDLDITIVDDDFSHFLGFTLPWVMRGWRDHDSVPIHPNTEALSGITTVVGSVRAIDPEQKTVTLADNTEIPFDALVIATGARNAAGRISGLQSAVDNGVAVHYYSADAAADAHRALQNFSGGKLVFLGGSTDRRRLHIDAADTIRIRGPRPLWSLLRRHFSRRPQIRPCGDASQRSTGIRSLSALAPRDQPRDWPLRAHRCWRSHPRHDPIRQQCAPVVRASALTPEPIAHPTPCGIPASTTRCISTLTCDDLQGWVGQR